MIAWWQILLLTLYAGYQIMDELNWYTCAGSAVFSGMITGLIMGDLQTGLFMAVACSSPSWALVPLAAPLVSMPTPALWSPPPLPWAQA